jgi:predicted permease
MTGMANFLLVILCFLSGIFLKKWKVLPSSTPQVLNGVIFYLALPSLILVQFNSINLDWEALVPVAAAWLLFLGSLLLFSVSQMRTGLNRKTTGVLILTAGLGNTGFLGYPFVEALYGKNQLSTAVLVDQPGSFLILSTLGIFIACAYSGRPTRLSESLKKVFSFPPTVFLIIALILSGFPFPVFINELLNKLGGLVTPLALISVGFQLKLGTRYLREYFWPLLVGLSYKLFLGPLFLALFFSGVFGLRGESLQVTIIETSMAPMITAGVVAIEYGLDAELVSLMLGIGIPLSFFTVPILAHFLKGL